MESLSQDHGKRNGAARGPASSVECEAIPGFRPPDAANDVRMAQLARTIEEEIIPRLMLAHRAKVEPLRAVAAAHQDVDRRSHVIGADDIRHFAQVVLSSHEDLAFDTIRDMQSRGVTTESLYLDLLAPTARYLGDLWNEDLCNFTDVTVGLGRLQRVLRELSPDLGRGVEHPCSGRRVLLMPAPGEQHTFGLVMVAEFFRSAGWDVVGGAWSSDADASSIVSTEWFDAVGFSLGSEVRLGALATAIAAVRQRACNRGVAVLVGGPLFGAHPEFVERVGADGMTIDGREAPKLAENLIGSHVRLHKPPG